LHQYKIHQGDFNFEQTDDQHGNKKAPLPKYRTPEYTAKAELGLLYIVELREWDQEEYRYTIVYEHVTDFWYMKHSAEHSRKTCQQGVDQAGV
jgi:hypothetical protein